MRKKLRHVIFKLTYMKKSLLLKCKICLVLLICVLLILNILTALRIIVFNKYDCIPRYNTHCFPKRHGVICAAFYDLPSTHIQAESICQIGNRKLLNYPEDTYLIKALGIENNCFWIQNIVAKTTNHTFPATGCNVICGTEVQKARCTDFLGFVCVGSRPDKVQHFNHYYL